MRLPIPVATTGQAGGDGGTTPGLTAVYYQHLGGGTTSRRVARRPVGTPSPCPASAGSPATGRARPARRRAGGPGTRPAGPRPARTPAPSTAPGLAPASAGSGGFRRPSRRAPP